MKFKRIVSILLIAISVISFTACNSKSPKNDEGQISTTVGGNIVVPITKEPEIINPAFTNIGEVQLVSNIIYSPLFSYGGGDVKTYLAESVDFKDNKEITIKLKDNLKWHDGKSVTADDLEYTINLILDEKQESPLREFLMVNEKPINVEKVDELTIKVTLPAERRVFLYNFSKIIPIPKHIYEGEDIVAKSEKNKAPIGSGPFKFKEWTKGDSIVLEKYNDYYSGTPKADMITIKVFPSEEAAEEAFNKGELTLVKASPELYDKAYKGEELQSYTFSEGRVNYIVFNQSVNYMQNTVFRKALSYALDRKEMIVAAYGESGAKKVEEANSILIKEAEQYIEENVEVYEHDIEKAKALIKESGVTDVSKLKLGYNMEAFEHKYYAEVAQKQLKDIGIEVEIIPYENKEFFNKVFSKGKECDLYINGYSLGLNPEEYRKMFETGSYYNQTGYTNFRVDDLWKLGEEELDADKRKAIYRDIQLQVASDAPIYVIDYQQNLMVAKKSLDGVPEARPIANILFEDWSKLHLNE
ncbi:ABC transporter substrate-binding protein [Clostridium sp. UBA1056]|uniref:ABC transporter substrate-binding protein n=1 Tax=unclassified Clostridium TaxID=2614128 RepID=UPI003217BBEB